MRERNAPRLITLQRARHEIATNHRTGMNSLCSNRILESEQYEETEENHFHARDRLMSRLVFFTTAQRSRYESATHIAQI